MAYNQVSPTIVIENNTSNAAGIASFVFGLISIFFLAPLFVPLAVLLGVIAVINKQLGWGILGLICASIGFITSPVLIGLAGVAALTANHSADTPTQTISYQPQQPQYQTPPQPTRAERLREAGETAKLVISECRNKRLVGDYKTFVASVNCSNPKIIEAYQNAGYPYMDLISQMAAKRLEVAEKIDAGKITEGQGQLEDAKFNSHIVDIERQRSAAAR